ncbi:MAG: energy-coupling factor ABC transporter ATP-binding protein [Chloroflexi bacterium]|nr:energy-coupling factor ABC transporter ATP-binding protein [Chloroflexota bacterium]
MNATAHRPDLSAAAPVAVTPAFELKRVTYRYLNRFDAIVDLDLVVQPGDQIAILGANGSGKSTLLKLLDGLYKPNQGRMSILGQPVENVLNDLNDTFQFHRQVGLVFQDPDVQLFSPTVWDEVTFGPLQLGVSREEVRERATEALEWMEIVKLKDRAPFELSGGEKKRAAIASVLSLRPEVLLLDEPTASLDPRSKWTLVNLIERLAQSGKTVVTATHELDIVPIIARRVIVLGEERRIIGDGPPEEILGDKELLVRANLIHEHLHAHGEVAHSHPHAPSDDHAHGHAL